MRIAILGYAHPFGEGTYYGAECEIYYLIRELKEMGHECVVFSVEGCNLPGFKFVELSKGWDDTKDIYKSAVMDWGDTYFDVIQSYQASGFIEWGFWKQQPYCLEPFFQFHGFRENVIAYSKRLRALNEDQSTVIYFGLPMDLYPDFLEESDDYLVWIGRIDMGKAPDIAIEVAKRAKKRLILMGPAYHYPYFVEKIWPHVDDEQIIWLRAVDDEIKQKVMRKAKGFLSTNWAEYHEMFGITNIEALACGVPVIGWGHATLPSAINFEGGEIITHGKHGFLNLYSDYSDAERERSIDKAVEYVNAIDDISRHDCRQLFLDRFTARTMAEKHVAYWNIIRERGLVYDVTGEI